MRCCREYVYCAALLFVNVVGSSLEDLLGTHQYFLVGLRQCTLSMETNVPAGQCPRLFEPLLSTLENPYKPCRIEGATLLWPSPGDPQSAAELLVVGRVQSTLAYNVLPLHFPYRFDSRAVTMERARFFSSPHRLTRDDLVGTLYDQRTQFLYLIFERTVDGAMRAEVFLMERIYSVTTLAGWQNTHKFSIDLHDSFFGSRWTSDSERAYYSLEETVDRQKVVGLRWIDFNQLVPSLKNGRHGTVVATAEGSSVPVELAPFRGLVYKKEHAADGTTHQLIDTLESERHLNCPSSAAYGPAFAFVITGWEYCKVRDGATANKSRCEEEAAEEATSSTGIPAKPQSHGSSIGMGISLVIICIIVINATLCLCIGYCVMRSRESKYVVSDRPPPMYTTMECTRRLQDSEMSF